MAGAGKALCNIVGRVIFTAEPAEAMSATIPRDLGCEGGKKAFAEEQEGDADENIASEKL